MTKVHWQPNSEPQTYALAISDVYETLYGGARGGGKTDCGMVWVALPVVDYPGYRGLVIRQTADDLSDWVDRAEKMYAPLGAKVSGKPAVFEFPSGAKIRCGHLRDDNAYTKYQGHEYQRILIEEINQIAAEMRYLKLLGSCRSTIPGLDAKMFATANPGDVGHAWVKARFIDGHTPNKAFKDPVSGRYRIYVPSRVYDNPAIMDNDPEYVRYLESLPEPLRSAWLNGDWDVFAGQYFCEWHPQKHVITEQEALKLGFKSTDNRVYMGIDHGYAAPFAAYWGEVTPDNTVFIYRELYGIERHTQEWGEDIEKINVNERLHLALGDPSMWARNPMAWNKPETAAYTDKSIADCLLQYIPQLVPANNSRVNGWRNMAQLMHFTDGTQPNFYVIKGSCPNLERTIPLQIRDGKNPEDIDTTGEDHAVDAVRYLLSHVQAPGVREPEKPIMEQQFEELLRTGDEDEYEYNFEVLSA